MKTLLASLLLCVLAVPAVADEAKDRLEKSPRHHEFVQVKQGARSVDCFVVYPEVKEKAATVIVIHENKGLTDWVRSAADEFAEAGYIAIAPDLLSGTGEKGGNTSSFASSDAATQAIYKLPPAQVTADLNAVADYALKIPAANGKLAVAGFCWGGGQSFNLATHRKDLKAALVFYGTPPDEKGIANLVCPVYGFYGGNDMRIDSTIPATEKATKAAGKIYEPVTYAGAGHAFMRLGDEAAGTEANKKARNESWTRLKDVLKKL